MSFRRLTKEVLEMHLRPPAHCSARPINNNLMEWRAIIKGVRGTPYYPGVFELHLKFSRSYPFYPPRVTFVTKIYHYNVDLDGYICWDLLTIQWTPIMTVSKILQNVCFLLSHPYMQTPFDTSVSALYMSDRMRYLKNAAEWTKRYAMPVPRAIREPDDSSDMEQEFSV